MGQEHFQDFNEEVRSKIAAVAGTLALEYRAEAAKLVLMCEDATGEH